ncbi:MAG TPA: hypothetical protein VNI57_13710 [Candidatus Saccharimonadales bacterium]|nr:hypothetical protein [Candidatus Saccharimonadales bacterium]
MTRIQDVLDHTHGRAVRSPWLRVFTAVVRVLLALAFVPSGLTKAMGRPFTEMQATTPIGAFFGAFFQAGAYYRFVGIAQLLAAALLIFPRTATLGAVVYFPIVLNIFVITVAFGFHGTWIVTGLMLLGSVYLLCWDYDRWKALLPGFESSRGEGSRHIGAAPALGFLTAAALVLWGAAGIHRAWLSGAGLPRPMLAMAAGALVAAVTLAAIFRMKSGPDRD